MFNPQRNNKNNETYTSFDDRLMKTYKSAKNEFKKIQAEIEEENNRKKPNRRIAEDNSSRNITPKSPDTIMDKRSYEGKINKRGSIEGEDPISALGHTMREGPSKESKRRRLEDKKKKLGEKRLNEEMMRKKKKELRKAIIFSEILAPPLSKRKKV